MNPPEEFYVKETKEANTQKEFIQIKDKEPIDPLYEKKYGRIYAYLTFFFVIFLIIYFRESLFKQKENMKKKNYRNLFDSNTNGYEYMLVKSE